MGMPIVTSPDLIAAWAKPSATRSDEEREAILAYRGLFTVNRRFRIIKSGGSLYGMRAIRGGQQGWRKMLDVDEVITCKDSSMTFGDGVPAVKWADANGIRLAHDCLFWPVIGGMWGGQIPMPGYLEPVAREQRQGSSNGASR